MDTGDADRVTSPCRRTDKSRDGGEGEVSETWRVEEPPPFRLASINSSNETESARVREASGSADVNWRMTQCFFPSARAGNLGSVIVSAPTDFCWRVGLQAAGHFPG